MFPWVKQTTSTNNFFLTSVSHPSIFSNSGEIPTRLEFGLGFGVFGGCCSPSAMEGGPAAAGRPGGGGGSPGGEGAACPGGGG
jgi:hypothetical protein